MWRRSIRTRGPRPSRHSSSDGTSPVSAHSHNPLRGPARAVRTVEADGLRLRVAVRGEGKPLLLLMGIGGNLDMWQPFEDRLDPSMVQTITVDAPGTGGSEPYRLPRRMPGLARTMTRLLDALGYSTVDVLGVSFGGVLAQQLAHQAPHRVRRLVLDATGPSVRCVPGSPRVLLRLATPRRSSTSDNIRRNA